VKYDLNQSYLGAFIRTQKYYPKSFDHIGQIERLAKKTAQNRNTCRAFLEQCFYVGLTKLIRVKFRDKDNYKLQLIK